MKGYGSSDSGEEHEAKVADTAIHRHHDIGDAVGCAGGGAQLFVDILELTDSLFLMTEYLDDLLTCHHLLDEAVDTCQALLLRAEIAT